MPLKPPPDIDPSTPAARAAHVRHHLAKAGIRRPCPSCRAAAMEMCRPAPGTRGPVYCVPRAFPADTPLAIEMRKLLVGCETDADYAALHADLEPLRLRLLPELDLGPAPIWDGHVQAPALSAGV